MLKEVAEILADYTDVPAEEITEDKNLYEDLEISSFDLLTIVTDFEQRFNVRVPDEELMKIQTVGDITALLEKKA